jgi:outer membrane protein OmpA-like peptidoglycan-associated protein
MTRARLSLSAAAFAVVGCGAASYPATKMVAVAPAAVAVQCAADADCGASQLCVDRTCHDVTQATINACRDMEIHFATASAEVDWRNRPELDSAAVCLRNHRDVHVTLAGNADERGAPDYNRALAQRRADKVASYLESVGVDPDRLATMTYGASDPICTAHDVECWRLNRRVELNAPSWRAGIKLEKNKLSTDDEAKGQQRIDSTGNGTDNGSPVGK